MEDPADDVYSLGWQPKESKLKETNAAVLKSRKVIRHLKAKCGRCEKRVPKPSQLDKALHMNQAGAA